MEDDEEIEDFELSLLGPLDSQGLVAVKKESLNYIRRSCLCCGRKFRALGKTNRICTSCSHAEIYKYSRNL